MATEPEGCDGSDRSTVAVALTATGAARSPCSEPPVGVSDEHSVGPGVPAGKHCRDKTLEGAQWLQDSKTLARREPGTL